MLDVIAIVAAVIAFVIAIVLILAMTKPDNFRVQRVATIKAPAETIFSVINDFHRWGSWSPWENKDPAMKRSFSGAGSGKGAVYAWDGNRNVGSGRLEILDTSAPSKITIKLDFFKPFEGHNTAEFTMLPQGDATATGTTVGTTVTWATFGPAPFMSKLMQVFMNMDSMIGKDFEIGLANLKKLTEK
jgi:Polyketide cyclase / dehydrase and lipid transport